jgi:hypothetical protein
MVETIPMTKKQVDGQTSVLAWSFFQPENNNYPCFCADYSQKYLG